MTSSPLFETATVAVQPCRYGPMMFLKQDIYIGRSLDVYGEWFEAEIGLIRQFLKPGDVVLDVGANIGTHTVPFAKAVGAGGHVFAFEAQPLIHHILCANAAINDLMNVTCLNLAAGRAPGIIHVPVLDIAVANNFGGFHVFGHAAGRQVSVTPIDHLRLTRCDAIKIDVEGAEVDVLAGADATIRLHRPVLFVENNSIELAPRVNAALEDLGYACWWVLCRNFNPDNFRGCMEDIFADQAPEANLLCIPRERDTAVHGLEPLAGVNDDWEQALARVRRLD